MTIMCVMLLDTFVCVAYGPLLSITVAKLWGVSKSSFVCKTPGKVAYTKQCNNGSSLLQVQEYLSGVYANAQMFLWDSSNVL